MQPHSRSHSTRNTQEFNKTGWGQNKTFFQVTSPVAGNYFPLASPGCIRIDSLTSGPSFAVVTDSAHGASSLAPGWAEIMLGRRVDVGDSGISVNDTDSVTSRTWLLTGTKAEVVKAHRSLASRISTPLLPVVASTPMTANSRGTSDTTAAVVDSSVHLLSLDLMNGGERALLRLQHCFQHGDDDGAGAISGLESVATVVLADLLAGAGVAVAQAWELPLNGVAESVPAPFDIKSEVTLHPMEIRTFEVVLSMIP